MAIVPPKNSNTEGDALGGEPANQNLAEEGGVDPINPSGKKPPVGKVDPNIKRALENLDSEERQGAESGKESNKENTPQGQQSQKRLKQDDNPQDIPAHIQKAMADAPGNRSGGSQGGLEGNNEGQGGGGQGSQGGQGGGGRQGGGGQGSQGGGGQGGGGQGGQGQGGQGGGGQGGQGQGGQGGGGQGGQGQGGQGGGGQQPQDNRQGGGGQNRGNQGGGYGDGNNGYEGRNGMAGRENNRGNDFGSPYSQRPNPDSGDGDGRSYGKDNGFQSGESARNNEHGNQMNSGMMDTRNNEHGNDPVNHASNMQGWDSKVFNAKLSVLPGVGEESNISNALSAISGSLNSIGVIDSINKDNSFGTNVAGVADGTIVSQGNIGHSGFDATFNGDTSLQNLPKQLTDADSLGGLKSGAKEQSAAQTALYSGGR